MALWPYCAVSIYYKYVILYTKPFNCRFSHKNHAVLYDDIEIGIRLNLGSELYVL